MMNKFSLYAQNLERSRF